MSQVDEEEILSETEEGPEEQLKAGRFVSVSESRRYRKRAQSAEKQNEQLGQQLTQTREQLSELTEQLQQARQEKELIGKLSGAGVIDLEAAVLLAKVRLERDDKADLDGCIEQLRREKPYLFGRNGGGSVTVHKTAGSKERGSNRGVLERAAKRAATTGDRKDLQEYLKLRRGLL